MKPLVAVMTDPDFETARSARRAVWQIVHYAGRPGAAKEAQAVEAELIPLLKHDAAMVRREVLWMLSEIGGPAAVTPMAALLSDQEVREDARGAIQRIPGAASIKALQAALDTAPEDFKFSLAEGLRKRGEKVAGYPSQKLVPTKQTSVKPKQAA